MSAESEIEQKQQEIAQILSQVAPKPWRRLAISVALLGALALGWWAWQQKSQKDNQPQWESAVVDRGEMVMSATATGNLRPRSQVDIGAEVSGRIASVEVTFNDPVKKGQVLARFDTELLEQSLDQARRAMAVEVASGRRAQASIEEAKANEARAKLLFSKGASSQAELDAARATLKRAQAEVDAARAQQRVAQLRVAQAQTNLERAAIISPIDGVVLQRNVEPGNTVASSLQSPNLFILARDLSEMELHVAIDEADVGTVAAGQSATFSVDAHPENTFKATVSLVHLFPATVNNVVTYTAVLDVDNKEGLLRPGMTAMATITTQTKRDTLRVPNAALRFKPQRDEAKGGGMMSLFSRRGRGGGSRGAGQEQGGSANVWILNKDRPKKLPVKVGRSDGFYTEILEGELKVGDKVLVGQKSAKP